MYEGDDAYHRRIGGRLRSSRSEREWSFEGEVLNLIPLRNRRRTRTGGDDAPWLHTRISEGMTRWTMADGRVGYGLSEYLDQIVDGQPVGLAEGRRRGHAREVQRGDRADHDRGRRRHVEERPARRGVPAAPAGAGVPARSTTATGVSGGRPPGHEPGGDGGPLGHTHEHHDRAAHPGQGLPVGRLLVAEAAMTGDDGDRGGQAAVGHGHTGEGGRRRPR